MRLLITVVCSLLLASCSSDLFRFTFPYFSWRLNDNDLKKLQGSNFSKSYLKKKDDDMTACGMSVNKRESFDPEVNLCMEAKGWYLTGGPVCENELQWAKIPCIEWRRKHSRPGALPWSYRRNSGYIKNVLGIEQAPMK